MPMTWLTFVFVPLASGNIHLMTLQLMREHTQQNNNHLSITFAVCLFHSQGDSGGSWSPPDLAINIMADFHHDIHKVDYAYLL